MGDFNTPLILLDQSSRQKVSKDASELRNTIGPIDLLDTSRIFHPTTVEFTFFSAAYGTFSKIDHILGHKASTSKFKKCDIIPCIFSDRKGMKLEFNCKKTQRNLINTWRLNTTLLNEEWIREEIRGEIKKFLETNKNRNNI